jgi:hypothetical protein
MKQGDFASLREFRDRNFLLNMQNPRDFRQRRVTPLRINAATTHDTRLKRPAFNGKNVIYGDRRRIDRRILPMHPPAR